MEPRLCKRKLFIDSRIVGSRLFTIWSEKDGLPMVEFIIGKFCQLGFNETNITHKELSELRHLGAGKAVIWLESYKCYGRAQSL